ncbi:MAG: cytosine permease [Burkholderiales bacterium]|nr:cytosine permease [Burkholderiales bacterium]
MSSVVRNSALVPVPATERPFGLRDHASLWLSLGVGLLVIQVGSFLVPAMGTREAFAAIVFGSILGAGLLAWTAKIGCDSGLSSAGLMHATYGSAFARLPIVLNIVQLIGWTTFELVVMRDGLVAILRDLGWIAPAPAAGAASAQALQIAAPWSLPPAAIVATLAFGALLLVLANGSMVTLVRRFVSRFGLPLVLISLAWLTWQFAGLAAMKGWNELWSRPGDGGMSLLGAVDLVIAMPISWLPLVADFSRHGRDGRGALAGTWIGYAIANAWCYTLGVLVALSAPTTDLVTALLLAQGGLVALGLILVDELDNAYGDVYSGAVASHSLAPRRSVRGWGMALAVLCTVLALMLPMHGLEPFLLLLSSVFVPLCGVILGRLGGLRDVAGRVGAARVEWVAVAIWFGGVALFHLLPRWTTDFGSALPTLAATFLIARLTRR